MSSENRHVCYRIYILGSQLVEQYKFGTLVSWEGNSRSGVALAMCHSGITTYGLTALGREMNTLPTLQ